MAFDDQHPRAKTHVERNRITRDDWHSFAPHRTRVTELMLRAARSDRVSLCILGAGNGNDFDLSSLTERYEKITLVDLDRSALDHCLAKLPADVAARVDTVASVDLSGMLDLLESIEQAIGCAGRPSDLAGLATYDVVASTCLLTQMIDSIVSTIGADHPRLADLVLALRDGHLKLLCDLTAASGTALLVTDFVSSDTLPQLGTVPDQELESLLARAINAGNFFTGVNPTVLAHRLGNESICGPFARVELYPPWRWQLGDRTYAVCGVSMSKMG